MQYIFFVFLLSKTYELWMHFKKPKKWTFRQQKFQGFEKKYKMIFTSFNVQ
jgi:hypothetical protein